MFFNCSAHAYFENVLDFISIKNLLADIGNNMKASKTGIHFLSKSFIFWHPIIDKSVSILHFMMGNNLKTFSKTALK